MFLMHLIKFQIFKFSKQRMKNKVESIFISFDFSYKAIMIPEITPSKVTIKDVDSESVYETRISDYVSLFFFQKCII